MDTTASFLDEGPFSYANWKAMEAGHPSTGATEYLLYTDAHITGNIEDGYGPYQLLNAVAYSDQPRLKPSIVLRMENHMPDKPVGDSPTQTDSSRYHGGGITDEIAAIVSLCLGIRLECGPCTRWFEPGQDVRGRPVSWQGFDAPTLPQISDTRALPYALGDHSLDDVAPLLTFTRLTTKDAVAVVRAARLYQDAVWIADAQPELAWVMLVSSVEVAAGQWRSAQDPPLERLRASRPALDELLKPYGDDLVQQVAEQIADSMGATKKFVDFLLHFLPEPRERRPDPFCQHPWEEAKFKKTFQIIYSYRSKALHGGTPFPAPMCRPFNYRTDGVHPEIPFAIATRFQGGVWKQKDTPLLLHTFEYIVRKSLLKWWLDMAARYQQPTDMGNRPMQHFQDDDEGYFQWLGAHPQGFVVGCNRIPSVGAGGFVGVLHHARCGYIRREGVAYTSRQYSKMCADAIETLDTWAAGVGGPLRACQHCQPR